MTSRTAVKILAATCVVELIALLYVVSTNPDSSFTLTPLSARSRNKTSAAKTAAKPGIASPSTLNATPDQLREQNAELETKLADVTKELNGRKAEISFSYGSLRDSGRFVGTTFRKMFEAAAAHEAKEAQERTADNQINVLSLGPFIQDAEVMESDPLAFAEFQGPLISEVLSLPAERAPELEKMLSDLKAQSLKVEMGSPEWSQLNNAALQRIKAMLSEGQRAAVKPQLDFLQQYGVLMIPAYSILNAPTPTVAPRNQ